MAEVALSARSEIMQIAEDRESLHTEKVSAISDCKHAFEEAQSPRAEWSDIVEETFGQRSRVSASGQTSGGSDDVQEVRRLSAELHVEPRSVTAPAYNVRSRLEAL